MQRYRHKPKRRRETLFIGILLLIVIIAIFIQNRFSFQNQKHRISENTPRYTGSTVSDWQNQQLFSDDWNLKFVNSAHLIPEDFSVEPAPLINGQAVDSRILSVLQGIPRICGIFEITVISQRFAVNFCYFLLRQCCRIVPDAGR